MNFLLANQAIVNHMWEYSGKASIHADYVHVILIPFDKAVYMYFYLVSILSYYDILSSLVGWHRNLASCFLLQELPPDGAIAAPAEEVSKKAWNFQRV